MKKREGEKCEKRRWQDRLQYCLIFAMTILYKTVNLNFKDKKVQDNRGLYSYFFSQLAKLEVSLNMHLQVGQYSTPCGFNCAPNWTFNLLLFYFPLPFSQIVCSNHVASSILKQQKKISCISWPTPISRKRKEGERATFSGLFLLKKYSARYQVLINAAFGDKVGERSNLAMPFYCSPKLPTAKLYILNGERL